MQITSFERLMELSGVQSTDSHTQSLLQEYVDIEAGTSVEELEHKFDIAKRMLGLANKLKNPAEKKKHLHMVMVITNKLRGALQRELAKLDADRDDYEYGELDQFRKAGISR